MFSEGYKLQKVGPNNDRIFIDRNGDIFQYVLDFLRSERDIMPSFSNPDDEVRFKQELEFWDISSLKTPANFNIAPYGN